MAQIYEIEMYLYCMGAGICRPDFEATLKSGIFEFPNPIGQGERLQLGKSWETVTYITHHPAEKYTTIRINTGISGDVDQSSFDRYVAEHKKNLDNIVKGK